MQGFLIPHRCAVCQEVESERTAPQALCALTPLPVVRRRRIKTNQQIGL